jgi:hypothetical protein
VAVALSILLSSVLIVFGIGIAANINTAMPALTGVSGMANATTYEVFSNVYASFNLATVVPVVAIAGVFVSLVVGVIMALRKSGVGMEEP